MAQLQDIPPHLIEYMKVALALVAAPSHPRLLQQICLDVNCSDLQATTQGDLSQLAWMLISARVIGCDGNSPYLEEFWFLMVAALPKISSTRFVCMACDSPSVRAAFVQVVVILYLI